MLPAEWLLLLPDVRFRCIMRRKLHACEGIYLEFTEEARTTCIMRSWSAMHVPTSCEATPLGGYPSGDAICIDKERQCDYDFNSANYFAYILATVCDIV